MICHREEEFPVGEVRFFPVAERGLSQVWVKEDSPFPFPELFQGAIVVSKVQAPFQVVPLVD